MNFKDNTNGSNELRERSAHQEWRHIRSEVGDGIAFANLKELKKVLLLAK